MKTKVLVAILAVLVAGSVVAEEVTPRGWLHPATSISLTGGLGERHNSYGFTAGAHISLFRLGPLRFPLLGADAGFAYVCDPEGREKVPGVHDSCAGRGVAGILQANIGGELTVVRRPSHEVSLVVSRGHVIAGPFKSEKALNFGLAMRW